MSSTSKNVDAVEPPSKMRKIDATDKNLSGSEDSSRLLAYDTETQKALEEIDVCQNEVDQLNEDASEEILKVEQKYNTLRKPLFKKRDDIITRIPNFWVTAFVNHPHISTLLEEVEEEALHYLTSVEVEEFEDIKSGYKIHFYFGTNPYFSNTTLTKEFRLANTGDPTTSSTPIQWKEDPKSTNPLKELHSQAGSLANGEGTSSKRKSKTFFGWYMDTQNPSDDETAEVIKDDLWPNPLHYYLVPSIEVEAEDEEDLDDEEEDNHIDEEADNHIDEEEDNHIDEEEDNHNDEEEEEGDEDEEDPENGECHFSMPVLY